MAWNAFAFLVMGFDKQKAKHGGRRVPEIHLFLIAFAMGGIGIFAGMRIFRHKTRHQSFRILVPLAVVLNLMLFNYISGVFALPNLN